MRPSAARRLVATYNIASFFRRSCLQARDCRSFTSFTAAGGGYRDWTNYSDVAKFAGTDRILVMPEGDDSYYTDATDRSAPGGANRAIVGVSMGGFGAVKLGAQATRLVCVCRRNQSGGGGSESTILHQAAVPLAFPSLDLRALGREGAARE